MHGNQVTTKNGKLIINKHTGLPIYGRTVEHRIKMIKKEIGEGLDKFDNVWNNIVNHNKRLKPVHC